MSLCVLSVQSRLALRRACTSSRIEVVASSGVNALYHRKAPHYARRHGCQTSLFARSLAWPPADLPDRFRHVCNNIILYAKNAASFRLPPVIEPQGPSID